MSLKEKTNLRAALVQVQTATPSVGGSLRRAAASIAKPTGRAMDILREASVRNVTATARGNVGFIIDATGSRDNDWEIAQPIQARMFEKTASIGQLKLRLIHYGGNSLSAHNWEKDSRVLAAQMAEVRCSSGGTQIVEGLGVYLEDVGTQDKANSIILVGDSFEENIDELKIHGERLATAGIKVFSFLEGKDEGAEKAFQMLADMTGGAFSPFGPDMPLEDLCEGVALVSVGGAGALWRLQNANARKALQGRLQLT